MTSGLKAYSSTMDEEDLPLIQLAYCVPDEFELKMPGLNAQVNNLPPSCLRVYEEALKARLMFFLFPFVLELRHFYRFLYMS